MSPDSTSAHALRDISARALAARSEDVDAPALEAALRRHLRGEVRFDSGSRALYATDGSNYRQVPIGVVLPKDTDDVIAAISICREHGAPVLCRGGGTSLAGQCCNVAVYSISRNTWRRFWKLIPGVEARGCSRASFSTTCAARRRSTT